MSRTLSNLMRVTGMGRAPAEVLLRTCTEAELVLIDAGEVQAGLDARAVRLSGVPFPNDSGEEIPPYTVIKVVDDDPTELIEPLNAGTPSGPSPAESESESLPADEAIE